MAARWQASPICLGMAVGDAIGGPGSVTVSLQMHFVSSVKRGDFVVGRAELVRCTRSLCFVCGLFAVGDRVAAQADGIWKILGPGDTPKDEEARVSQS